MPITAKELAARLNLSATAVSMALNNKPGVSTETRRLVIRTAEEEGYDFSRIKRQEGYSGSVYVIFYKSSNAILSYTPIFDELYEGICSVCRTRKITARLTQFNEKTDDLEEFFADLRESDCMGIILVGTEMKKEMCEAFTKLRYPLILLDTWYESLDCTSVVINNTQGAYLATDFLIGMTGSQPGYLHSSYSIPNFEARQEGYFKALSENGMSRSRSLIHRLSPSIDNAMADMLELLDDGVPVARSYFADNDIIAIGAMKAFRLRGYRIPEDIAVVGFDNISESRIIEPALTTMDVPRLYLGQTAAKLLLERLDSRVLYQSKVEVSTRLVKRLSHCMR